MENKSERIRMIEGLERAVSLPDESHLPGFGGVIITRDTAKTILELLKEPASTKTVMIYGTHYCKSCMQPLLTTDKFCRRCGKELDWSSGFIHWGERMIKWDDNANHCVGCGDVIPEGRMVCPNCEVKE